MKLHCRARNAIDPGLFPDLTDGRWVNGQEVIGIYGIRQMVSDDGVSKRLTLKQGKNIARCAIINAVAPPIFCARFLDAQDKPFRHFTATPETTAI